MGQEIDHQSNTDCLSDAELRQAERWYKKPAPYYAECPTV